LTRFWLEISEFPEDCAKGVSNFPPYASYLPVRPESLLPLTPLRFYSLPAVTIQPGKKQSRSTKVILILLIIFVNIFPSGFIKKGTNIL
jgi:hypothetical protein